MTQHPPDINFSGSIPALYDEFLGPVIFTPYADDLVRRVRGRLTGGRLLETACGTGLVTRLLVPGLPGTEIVATDLNEGMLRYAQTQVGAAPGLSWRPADAAALPFGAQEFDAVVNQFGMMFVPDKRAAFQEARRVLRPGGWFTFNVWGSIAENAFARVAHATIGTFFPSNPPTFYQVPFGFNDAAEITEHFRSAGFTDVITERVQAGLTAPSARDFARGLVEGNPVVTAIREGGVAVAEVVAAVTAALTREGGAAPFRSTMTALVCAAKAGR